MHALFELAVWLQAGEDRAIAIAAGGGQPRVLKAAVLAYELLDCDCRLQSLSRTTNYSWVFAIVRIVGTTAIR